MPRYHVTVEDKEYDIEIDYRSEKFDVTVDGQKENVECHIIGEHRSILLLDTLAFEVDISANGNAGERVVFLKGQEVNVHVEDYNLAQMKKTAGLNTEQTSVANLTAPMPGLVMKLLVEKGQAIKKNEPLVIIEAMKMENIIKAKSDAVVKNVNVKAGQSVEKDDLLLEFE